MTPTYMFGLSYELLLLFKSVVIGIIFGVVFDALRVVRIIFPHKSWLVFIEDFIFMLFCGFWFFVFSMTSAVGQLRAFLIIGALAGFFLYIFTVGEIVRRFITKTRDVIRAFLRRVYYKLYNKVYLKAIYPILSKIKLKSNKFLSHKVKLRKKSKKTVKKVLKV